MYRPLDVVRQPLHVITCVYNPARFKSRYKLYRDFQARMRETGAILHTIEAVFGEREYALTEHALHDGRPEEPWKSFGPAHVPGRGQGNYLQVRLDDHQEIWTKENLLNLAVQRLPPEWKYVALVDADIAFVRPDIVSETLHQLQHYPVVQMYSEAVDLDPHYGRSGLGKGNDGVRQFSHAYCHVNGLLKDQIVHGGGSGMGSGAGPGSAVSQGNVYRHPGFAWAWRREALNAMGGLMEHVLLGSADWHMAWALSGRVEETMKGHWMAPSYRHLCLKWQRAADHHIQGHLGYVDGLLMHHWHGKKVDRGYRTRWRIMADHSYDPGQDLEKDWQGVVRITDKKPRLVDDVRQYFRRRNEDSIDL